jgi:UDP-2,3-diacylglucosamine pyrophosphatase LpxH
VQKLLRKARKGTEVIYVPGNHDEFARDYVDYSFGDIQISRHAFHETVDGKRMLIIHGDECDGVMIYARWLAVLGDHAYGAALTLNNWYNALRRRIGLPYWSLSKYLKNKVKNAVQFIDNYEGALARLAREHSADGVVCGHIHHAVIKDIDGITYCNDGDWVESCTALVEHFDGRLEIIHWADLRGLVPTGTAENLIPVSLPVPQKADECAFSLSPTLGTHRSTASSVP